MILLFESVIFAPLCAVGLVIGGGWSLLWLCCVTGIVPKELQEESDDRAVRGGYRLVRDVEG